ncbi:UxaA family hydrolase [Halomarina pelagica]|uniref:UxaA family hydrolase n=1 Tax=Halomarina pelagica TaxID=2961599 RepID=UPI0020C30716|nr:UxaA family hydrolase [Halomarina sp. BND7]
MSAENDLESAPEAGQFEGFERPDGSVGVRNAVLVLPSVICSHVVADRIADAVPEAVSTPHGHGCAQIGSDNDQTRRTFLGLGSNPNVAGTVVVGLGCEVLQSEDVAARLAERDVPVRELSIQGVGGTDECVEEGVRHVRDLRRVARETARTRAHLGDLTVGVVSSDLDDSTVGEADPLVGRLVEAVVEAGGRVVVAGNERLTAHPDAARAAAATDAVADAMDALFARHRGYPAKATRVAAEASGMAFEDATRSWGGLPVNEVVDYGDRVTVDSGVAVLDAPSRFEEAATGLAAAGAQLVVHVTADGIPAGHPVVPVVKVSGDAATVDALAEDIDVDARRVDGATFRERLLAVADGAPSRAERHGLTQFAITRVGPSM